VISAILIERKLRVQHLPGIHLARSNAAGQRCERVDKTNRSKGMVSDFFFKNLPSTTHRIVASVNRQACGIYKLTMRDADSGATLGCILRQITELGKPPQFDLSDILTELGDTFKAGFVEIDLAVDFRSDLPRSASHTDAALYREATLTVDRATRDVASKNRRIARSLRRVRMLGVLKNRSTSPRRVRPATSR
jgi:hypothetical protein